MFQGLTQRVIVRFLLSPGCPLKVLFPYPEQPCQLVTRLICLLNGALPC